MSCSVPPDTHWTDATESPLVGKLCPFPCFYSCVSVWTYSSRFPVKMDFISNTVHGFVHEYVTCQPPSSVICILLSAACQRQWCVTGSTGRSVIHGGPLPWWGAGLDHTRLANKHHQCVMQNQVQQPSIHDVMKTPDPNQDLTLKQAFEICEEQLKGPHFASRMSNMVLSM